MSSIVNDVLFVDSHVEASLELLFHHRCQAEQRSSRMSSYSFAFHLQESSQLEPEAGDSEFLPL
jgi:hypothetical protein